MKNMFNVLLTLCIPVLFFIGCEDKTLPFEPVSHTNENSSLSKIVKFAPESFHKEKAERFMEQAQEKIDKAKSKVAA
ncbi:hypothetical protein ACFL0J_08475, partial [Candidatus Neomarinimicrobiota bacterium]